MTDRPALVQRVLGGAAVAVLDRLPVPLALARVLMLVENAVENARGGWGRLRDEAEADRYRAVRAALERHAPDGFVLDVGCSQGILQEGLRYRRYVGVDRYTPALQQARGAGTPNTTFVTGDASRYVPDTAPDAVVLNEVLYYLPRPVQVVERYASLLAPGGVVVVSCYARTWPTRRLLRRLLRRLRRRLVVVAAERVVAGPHAWDVVVLAPRR